MRRALLLALAVLLPAQALAAPDDALRAKVRERVRALRTARLIELIELDEATTARLIPVLNRFDDQLEPVLRDLGEARREMRAQIEGGKPDGARLNKLIDRVLVDRDKIQKIDADRAREVRKVLTPVQMAKIVVVFPEVDRYVRKLIRKGLERRNKVFDDDEL